MKATDSKFAALLKKDQSPLPSLFEEQGSFSNKVKDFLKGWPRFFNFLKKLIGPGHSPGNRYNLKSRLKNKFGDDLHDKVILNIGSGTYRIDPEIINIDIFPFKEVDLVADVTRLPFVDHVADAIVCDAVMEHVADTEGILKEMVRVLKPGGLVFITVPFMYPYHSSPNDFYRWTKQGLSVLIEKYGLSVHDVGASAGPMGTLQSVLMHVFAILFSFGSEKAYFLLTQLFMLLLAPIKILDYVFMPFRFSLDLASHIFIVAQKN